MSWLSGVWERWGTILETFLGTTMNKPKMWTSTEVITKVGNARLQGQKDWLMPFLVLVLSGC
eukprot:1140719-Pelagomonas_calceolata.AAC.1